LRLLETRENRALLARGFVLGHIDTLGDRAYSRTIPESWLDTAGWTDVDKSPPDCFWRIIVADHNLNGHTPPPHYFQLACKYAFGRRAVGNGLNTATFPFSESVHPL
jgi:hypothetical protein